MEQNSPNPSPQQEIPIRVNPHSQREVASRARRIPGIPFYWENYLVSILFLLLLPLLPIAFELILHSHVFPQSLVLAAAMYTFSVGVNSRSRLIFGLTIVESVFLTFLYGMVSGATEIPPIVVPASYLGIILTFLFHSCERYNRHVIDRSPFLEFLIN